MSIEDVHLHRSMKDYEVLTELQEDIARSKRDAARLIAVNPAREESYNRQLETTLAEINRRANAFTLDCA